MTSARHERVGQLFLQAIELAAEERAAFLHEECGDDRAMRREVESLLAGEEAPTSFLDRDPILGDATPLLEPRALTSGGAMPERIGQYEIESVLGEGGMGIVYRARQHDPERIVALKVIRAGVSTANAIRRFEHEKQVLARLHHPGIAQIYDAGTFDVGTGAQPYFAMEFVRGESLTAYAERYELTLEARARLLVSCCAAVEHAHQKGVIHRDLKPANILVEAGDKPRILDFGVARVATTGNGDVLTMHTGAGQLLGTLPYMSPEQVGGTPDDLDTRSDVYTLGVLAYQLLSGRLPYDVETRGFGEAARMIAEDEPQPLARTRPELRGDLSTIVATALEKDRDRRYQSAAALADDLECYLDDRPISARPATALYRIRKYARRNRIAFVSIVLVMAALILGVAGTTTGLVRAMEEGRRLAAMNEYFRSMLTSLTPSKSQGTEVTVLDMVRTAEDNLASMLGAEPMVRAEVEATIGAVYRSLGDLGAAERVLLAAAERAGRHAGAAHETTLIAHSELARMYSDQGRYAEAAALSHAVLRQQRALRGWNDPQTLAAANLAGWSSYLIGDHDVAAEIFRDTVPRRRRVLGPDHEGTLLTLANLALSLMQIGELNESDAVAAEAVAGHERTIGERHPNTLYAKHVQATVWGMQGRHEEAAALHLDVVDAAVEVLGREHGYTLFWRIQLSADLRQAGAYDEAGRHALEVVNIRRTQVGGGAGNLVDAINELAAVRRNQQRLDEAEQLTREALRISGELDHFDPSRDWWTRVGLAHVMARQGRRDEALEVLVALERETASADAGRSLRRSIADLHARVKAMEGDP